MKVDSYVELKPGCDEVYMLACAGAPGWVREMQTDDDGFRQVYIEWDKDNWRYTGEPDLWTFEDHFNEAEPHGIAARSKGNQPPTLDDEPENPITRFLEESSKEREPCESCGEVHDAGTDRIESYINELENAMETASGADGFVLLSITSRIDPLTGNIIAFPRLFSAAHTSLAATLLESQIAELAAHSYQEQAIENLKRKMKEEE